MTENIVSQRLVGKMGELVFYGCLIREVEGSVNIQADHRPRCAGLPKGEPLSGKGDILDMTRTSSKSPLKKVSLQPGIIYGPVQSRRLGRSLGINLLPAEYKTLLVQLSLLPIWLDQERNLHAGRSIEGLTLARCGGNRAGNRPDGVFTRP
jgi:hypothetical protein